MTAVVVAAQRGVDLYLLLDAPTGVIVAVGTATELPVNPGLIHLATLDGSSDLLDNYGWRAVDVPICDVWLPRNQLAALARAVDQGDTRRRADILRHAGRRSAA